MICIGFKTPLVPLSRTGTLFELRAHGVKADALDVGFDRAAL